MPDAGDVVWVKFPGAVVTKARPAVVISSAEYHANRPDIILALITSNVANATAPSDHILIDWQAAGLRVKSAVRAYISTIPRADIERTAGRLTDQDWQAVKQCLSRAIVK